MGAPRHRGQGRSWPAIRWQTPSLVVALVTLVVVTATVLADTPPRSANPLPSNTLPSPDATATPIPVSTPPPGRWVIQNSAIAASLVDISCGDASHCVAVGAAGMILSTADAGNSWSTGRSGISHALVGVSCPSPIVCYAVSNFGELLKTGDGGTTWAISALRNPTPFAISCATTADCVTADGFVTHNGGGSWQQGSRIGSVNGGRPTSCRRYACSKQLGHGRFLRHYGGGWTLQAATPYFLHAVICTRVDRGVAAGGGESGTNI